MEDNQKSLINNFVFYLMTIEDLVQKASGKDLFLPQEWRSHSFS